MENREIARILAETADLMEIAGEDGFRIRSYRNAASAIEGYPERVEDILAGEDRKVTDIPGVGKSIAAHLGELSRTGSFEKRDALLALYPPTLLELLRIQGLGPKGIALLYQHYKVATIDELERICKEQKLRELPRMGAKLEEKVLKSIAQYRQRTGRFLLSFGKKVADELIPYLAESGGLEQIAPAGSLRRGKDTIGDLDLLATGPGAAAALERFVKHPKVHNVLGKGENKASVQYGLEGLQVDLRALAGESYGAAMQYFTGSKEHNILVRSRALKLGLTLNEYGLFRVDNEQRVAGETEEQVYAALGLAWIPPELRENSGEIEAALEGRLPKLIDLADIRGDLHMHTLETDGRATLEEMAEAARALGYQYIAITDHSKALAMANGLDEKRAVDFARQVRKINQDGLGIRIFSGLECDIRRDGAMDLAGDALAELDIVVASVHSHMNLEPAEMTDRLMRALESPSVRVLGHPTGRLLLNRDPYPFDFERVAAEAVRRNVYLEINGSPERLDLPGAMIRTAKALGAKFAINTDSHHPKHLGINMPFGVITARRGWLEARDVLNTLPLAEFEKAIRKS
ncbi:MAG TPA: DNA polymerase/3'-5' exonuclease PolX [Bryobacteraceae bacterium]|nr:DNA polymerase/3'-5' exonuclease PolX [Bryobacteraceae bacterium]HUO31867.1 DNA polymerase/3'-5' exonuclease PolX [Bryobacteraceae bacterium]